MSSSSSDAEYIEGQEDANATSKTKRETKLTRLWPMIKERALKGMQPQQIAEEINETLDQQDWVDNRQVQGKISRERKKGNIKMPVNKSGTILAENSDCMFIHCSIRQLLLIE